MEEDEKVQDLKVLTELDLYPQIATIYEDDKKNNVQKKKIAQELLDEFLQGLPEYLKKLPDYRSIVIETVKSVDNSIRRINENRVKEISKTEKRKGSILKNKKKTKSLDDFER